MPDHRGLRCRIHVNQCVLSSDNKRSAKLGSGEVDFDIALKIMKMYFCLGDNNWADRIEPNNFVIYQVFDHAKCS